MPAMPIRYVLGVIRSNYNNKFHKDIVNHVKQANENNKRLRKPEGRVWNADGDRIIDQGICTLLSMYWLIRVRECKPRNRGILYEKFGDESDLAENGKQFRQIAEYFLEYGQDMNSPSYNDPSARIRMLKLDGAYLKKCAEMVGGKKRLRIEPKKEAYIKVEKTDETGDWEYNAKRKYRLVRLFFSNNEGHRIAMYYESPKLVYVFDPNMGTIRVDKPADKELGKVLFDVVKEIVDGILGTRQGVTVDYNIIDTVKTG